MSAAGRPTTTQYKKDPGGCRGLPCFSGLCFSSVASHDRRVAEAIVQADLGHPYVVEALEPVGDARRANDAVAGEGLGVPLEAHVEKLALQAPIVPDRPFGTDASSPAPLGALRGEDAGGDWAILKEFP